MADDPSRVVQVGKYTVTGSEADGVAAGTRALTDLLDLRRGGPDAFADVAPAGPVYNELGPADHAAWEAALGGQGVDAPAGLCTPSHLTAQDPD